MSRSACAKGSGEKAIGEIACRCYPPANETDGRLLHAIEVLRGEMDNT